MPAPRDAAVSSSTSELLDFSTFLRERTENFYENKGPVLKKEILDMKRVTGLGGLFFKAEDPEKLYAWYEKHLGLQRQREGGVIFNWRQADDPQKAGMTVWSIFPKDTKYFDPSRSSFMMDFRVEDLDGLLAALREEGVEVDPHREDYDYGRFA